MTGKITGDVDMTGLAAALDSEGLLNALKDRLKATENAAFLEKLPPKVLKRVEVLKEIQSEHDELEAKFFEERRALEDKYQKLYQPLYTKRYDIVNGVIEVDEASNELGTDQEAGKAVEEKGVPNFWVTAMKTNEVLADVIQEHDEDALGYLKDIKWCRVDLPKADSEKNEASKGFKLEFIFNDNPYFKNSILTKTYHMIDEDEPILEKAIGTEIDWFPGKCLTQKVLKKKPKKGSKNSKPIMKTETVDSFFNFFTPPEVPDDEEEIEEDDAEELQAQMEQDYDIGSTIRDKIIPHAVSWYTGEAAQDDDFDIDDEDDDDDVDEEDDEDDEEDEDEEDEDEDDEEDVKKKPQKKAHHRDLAGDGQQAGERPPECKQQ